MLYLVSVNGMIYKRHKNQLRSSGRDTTPACDELDWTSVDPKENEQPANPATPPVTRETEITSEIQDEITPSPVTDNFRRSHRNFRLPKWLDDFVQ